MKNLKMPVLVLMVILEILLFASSIALLGNSRYFLIPAFILTFAASITCYYIAIKLNEYFEKHKVYEREFLNQMNESMNNKLETLTN